MLNQQSSPPPSIARPAAAVPATSSFRLPAIALAVLALIIAFAALLPFDYRVAVTLGIVQGLGEFLPISSSAHLILTPWFFGWPDPGLTFDVALHVGTLVAVVAYFWRDLLKLVLAAPRPRTPDGRLAWLLVLGAIPGGLAGVLLDDLAEQAFRNPLLIAGTLSLMGLGLYFADRHGANTRREHDIGLVDALAIGTAQALAIVPGVSRSGITIAVARWRGIERAAAARFSFLLGTPLILGAAVFKLRHLIGEPGVFTGPFIAGIVAAAIVGVLSIAFVLRYLQRAGLGAFVVYRLLLAALVVSTILLGLRGI